MHQQQNARQYAQAHGDGISTDVRHQDLMLASSSTRETRCGVLSLHDRGKRWVESSVQVRGG